MSAYEYAVFLMHCDNKEVQQIQSHFLNAMTALNYLIELSETKQITIDPKVLEIEDVATSALYLAKLVCAFSTEKT
jgi:hypothetical protein